MIWLTLLVFVAWAYLLLLRGSFWMMRERDERALPRRLRAYPAVIAVVPARNEADVIGTCVASLLAQDYPGRLDIIVIDDQSTDETRAAALAAAQSLAERNRLEIVIGAERPPGWVGKTWAMRQGVELAETRDPPDYYWFTDADIGHAPDNLAQLAERAEAGHLAMVSLMAQLASRSLSEKLLIPAFVYFFAMLFPFAWVNRKESGVAAAAGGCMLVRADALRAAGGIETIRGEIIDDCALARAIKKEGPIWLGLTRRARSLRPYGGIGEIGRMIARSAYAQLGYSLPALIATVLGMALLFIAPPLLAVFVPGPGRGLAIGASFLMLATYGPILRFYRQGPWWALLIPLTGLLYVLFTIASAWQFWHGRGGMWKGRAQAIAKAS